ncbi:MAG: hypothetical protein IKY98_02755 [Alphaproteobacteria bacterium]|nr:hypothetical protein [Alphaproteobacteria bacterium]
MKTNKNKDIIPLDTPEGSEYDEMDIIQLDTHKGHKNDKRKNESEYNNIEPSSLSFPCLTRESSRKMKHCFSGYSCQSTNMIKGNNTLSMINEDNAPSMTEKTRPSMTNGNNALSSSDNDTHTLSPLGEQSIFPLSIPLGRTKHFPHPVTLGRSETKTRGSRITNAYASALRIAQSGRSMVEMLGVLAVIGVLSIGGIMGYSYGMDKYRANEVTNQIMLRAIDLMTQASQNRAELSLTEWKNESSQYDFGEPAYTNDGSIVFDVGTNNPLPKNICKIVYDNLSTMASQIDINAVRTESNNACAEENEMTFYFEGGIAATCNPACPEGQYCDNGICFKGNKPEGSTLIVDMSCSSNADCNKGWSGTCAYCAQGKCHGTDYDGNSCTITDGNIAGQCYGIQCIAKGCTTNNDCKDSRTFCASPNNSSEARFKENETGSCVPLDFVRKEIDKKIYYISSTSVSWWDAEYACHAIGPNIEMIEIDDLVKDWDGKTGTHEPSNLAKRLSDVINFQSVWIQETPDAFNYDSLSYGQAGSDNRDHVFHIAVCK